MTIEHLKIIRFGTICFLGYSKYLRQELFADV